MIHYQLQCSHAHTFDGWFRDSAAFDKQAAARLVECPECGDTAVERALMAPAVAKRQSLPMPIAAQAAVPAGATEQPRQTVLPPGMPEQMAVARLPAQMLAALQRLRAEVEKHADYVGPSFAEEARKIHRGETEERPIYGESTEEQAESLAEEGIMVSRIPWVPRADG
jgi:hypothetical protein